MSKGIHHQPLTNQKRRRKPSAPLTEPVKPFKQGTLDSLCGLYAWINAIHYLQGPLTREQAIDLFQDMTEWLARKKLLAEVLDDGMNDRLLMRLYKWHIARYQPPSGSAKVTGGIQTRPLRNCVFPTAVHLRSHLSDCPLLQRREALLLLNFEDSNDDCRHISLARACDSEHLWLFDSSEWECLPWDECRVPQQSKTRNSRYVLYPRYMRWLNI